MKCSSNPVYRGRFIENVAPAKMYITFNYITFTSVCMSSLVMWKSKTSVFSTILCSLLVFGMHTNPCCRLHLIIIWAGVLLYLENYHILTVMYDTMLDNAHQILLTLLQFQWVLGPWFSTLVRVENRPSQQCLPPGTWIHTHPKPETDGSLSGLLREASEHY